MTCKKNFKVRQKTAYEELKELKRKRKEIGLKKQILFQEKERVESEMKNLLEEEKIVEKEIKTLSKEGSDVMDHAIVRFFERCLGYDIDMVKNLIITEKTKKVIETTGNTGKFPFAVERVESLIRKDFKPKKEFFARMKGGFVVTILED